MEDRKNKNRVFLCSQRAVAIDGVRGRAKASFWKTVVREDMLAYVSKVPGIGVGTGAFVLWTKRMPGVNRYDPPGRLCNWPEPIECRRHPFGFDWKARRAEIARVCNLTDTPANAELERPPKFRKPHNNDIKVVSEAVGMGNIFSITLPPGARAGFGKIRKPGEYLWSPSKRQLAEERKGKGWQLQQLQPDRVQLEMTSTVAQVVEVSPGVSVAYPVDWLRAHNKPEYVKVTLLNGSVVRYCQETVDVANWGVTWGCSGM